MGAIHRLTHLKASKLIRPGIYEDGGGLRLVVGSGATKRWVVRVTIQGQRKERGLGGFPTVSLDEARSKAAEFRAHAKQGRDLAFERKIAEAKSTTFKRAFKAFYEMKSKVLSNRSMQSSGRALWRPTSFQRSGLVLSLRSVPLKCCKCYHPSGSASPRPHVASFSAWKPSLSQRSCAAAGRWHLRASVWCRSWERGTASSPSRLFALV